MLIRLCLDAHCGAVMRNTHETLIFFLGTGMLITIKYPICTQWVNEMSGRDDIGGKCCVLCLSFVYMLHLLQQQQPAAGEQLINFHATGHAASALAKRTFCFRHRLSSDYFVFRASLLSFFSTFHTFYVGNKPHSTQQRFLAGASRECHSQLARARDICNFHTPQRTPPHHDLNALK